MRIKWPLDLRESGFAAATVMLAATICARGVLEEDHPTAEAGLRAGQPTPSAPLTVAGMADSRGQRLDTYARSLRFGSFEASGARLPSPAIEVVIPVPAAVCRRDSLPRVLRCGRAVSIRTAFASLDWQRVMNLGVRFSKPRSMTIDSVASSFGSRLRTWTVDLTGNGARLEYHCLHPTGFQLIFPGTAFKARCESGGRTLRLTLRAPASDAPTLYLDGTRGLSLKLTGSRVRASADGGIVAAGGSTSEVERHQRLRFRSESADLAVDLGVGADPADRHLEVTGPRVSSILIGGDERLPTRFDAVKDLWQAVFGAMLSLTLASLGALLATWPRRTGG
ncbi:MAG TPA: hypothetical protein VFJ53_02730 [Solirubrobacterales bacterium]|nr:hypothetical protein [Solirubrobacterales bacterium]